MIDDSAVWKAWIDYANDDLKYEQSRKASFDTRAFALSTANLALAALTASLIQAFKVQDALLKFPTAWATIATLSLFAASVFAAVAVAYPRRYPSLKSGKYFKGAKDLARENDPSRIYREIVKSRDFEIWRMRQSNAGRAFVAKVSFWCLISWPVAAVVAGYGASHP